MDDWKGIQAVKIPTPTILKQFTFGDLASPQVTRKPS